ncbi:unnamed protein product, partial [Prorocentrum cordatum]
RVRDRVPRGERRRIRGVFVRTISPKHCSGACDVWMPAGRQDMAVILTPSKQAPWPRAGSQETRRTRAAARGAALQQDGAPPRPVASPLQPRSASACLGRRPLPGLAPVSACSAPSGPSSGPMGPPPGPGRLDEAEVWRRFDRRALLGDWFARWQRLVRRAAAACCAARVAEQGRLRCTLLRCLGGWRARVRRALQFELGTLLACGVRRSSALRRWAGAAAAARRLRRARLAGALRGWAACREQGRRALRRLAELELERAAAARRRLLRAWRGAALGGPWATAALRAALRAWAGHSAWAAVRRRALAAWRGWARRWRELARGSGAVRGVRARGGLLAWRSARRACLLAASRLRHRRGALLAAWRALAAAGLRACDVSRLRRSAAAAHAVVAWRWSWRLRLLGSAASRHFAHALAHASMRQWAAATACQRARTVHAAVARSRLEVRRAVHQLVEWRRCAAGRRRQRRLVGLAAAHWRKASQGRAAAVWRRSACRARAAQQRVQVHLRARRCSAVHSCFGGWAAAVRSAAAERRREALGREYRAARLANSVLAHWLLACWRCRQARLATEAGAAWRLRRRRATAVRLWWWRAARGRARQAATLFQRQGLFRHVKLYFELWLQAVAWHRRERQLTVQAWALWRRRASRSLLVAWATASSSSRRAGRRLADVLVGVAKARAASACWRWRACVAAQALGASRRRVGLARWLAQARTRRTRRCRSEDAARSLRNAAASRCLGAWLFRQEGCAAGLRGAGRQGGADRRQAFRRSARLGPPGRMAPTEPVAARGRRLVLGEGRRDEGRPGVESLRSLVLLSAPRHPGDGGAAPGSGEALCPAGVGCELAPRQLP